MDNIICSKCRKEFKGEHPGYWMIYDKCRGKKCHDCGKIRKLGKVKTLYWENTRFGCIKCGKASKYLLEGIGDECFIDQEKRKGCVCALEKFLKDKVYYCSLCEEYHDGDYAICKECSKKQDAYEVKKQNFFQLILPTFVISLVLGFFLGWLFLVKPRKKKKRT